MEEEDRPQERRAAQRAPIELRVEYRRLNMFFADYTRNISKGGTFIHTDRPLPIGTEFMFALTIPSIDKTLSILGKVKWTVSAEEATEDKPAGMGIEFQYRDGQERGRIHAMVERMMVNELGEELAHELLKSDE